MHNDQNELKMETSLHPERTFFGILQERQEPFFNLLQEAICNETSYWTTLLAASLSKEGKAATTLQSLTGIHTILEALEHEEKALNTMIHGVTAEYRQMWGEAAIYYQRATGELHSAYFDWQLAISTIAQETPFDHTYATREERKKYRIIDPPRSSYKDMQPIAPHLFHFYQSMDRTFCIGQELTQRQIACLTRYMQGAEAKALQEQQTDTHE